ncbi:MAG TPA: efflux RND transporter periplasmic adaptor subunit [Steroidobacteraceae bacterium]|jgi:RND family efflux transporter MFP subunit|nr:efflux RND transporter periplasmic adaptor subunit [Steroidobacteraceae bacterium]
MSQPDRSPGRSRVRLRQVGGAAALLAIAVVAYGLGSRAAQTSRLHELTEEQTVPTVAIVTPTSAVNSAGLELPGRLEAFIRAPIYARVPGYLKSWKHDIGAKVKAGDVLAEIETPDLDQQLMQARADLNVAQANAKLAQIGAERWQSLAGTDAVAKQDVDQRTFTWNANVAQVKSAQANVDRLVAMEDFKRLVAPFNGIVTSRDTDIGALINVGAAGGAQLFVVSETSKLRIFVNVPQNYVPSVPSGTKATITVPEHPDKTYGGTVEDSAQAVNPSTGTTLMQIIVDNSAGELMPGDYASIHLQIAGAAHVLSVPSSALIFDAKGLSIATVDANNRVMLKPVTIERDLGAIVELASGLSPDDRVIQNPLDGIANGTEVRLAAASDGALAGKSKKANEKG